MKKHWTQAERPTACVRCGAPLGTDKRRRYCSYDCSVEAQRDYHRDLKRQKRKHNPERERRRAREYRQSEHGKAITKAYAAREDVRVRRLLLDQARGEAKERGVPTWQVLVEWKADLGQVRGR